MHELGVIQAESWREAHSPKTSPRVGSPPQRVLQELRNSAREGDGCHPLGGVASRSQHLDIYHRAGVVAEVLEVREAAGWVGGDDVLVQVYAQARADPARAGSRP